MIQNVLIETNAASAQTAAASAQASKGDGLAGLFAALLQSLQGSVEGQAVDVSEATDAETQSAAGQAAETPAPEGDGASELASLLAGITAPVKGLETPASKVAASETKAAPSVLYADTGEVAPESAKVVTGVALPGRNGVSTPEGKAGSFSVAASVASAAVPAETADDAIVAAEAKAGSAPAVSEPRGAPQTTAAIATSPVAANAPPAPTIAVPVVEGPEIAVQAAAAPKAVNADVTETLAVKPETFTVAAAAASESDAGVEATVAAPVVRAASRVTRDAPESFVPTTNVDAEQAAEGAVQVKTATPARSEAALAESDVHAETPEPRVVLNEPRAALPANPRAETVPLTVTREALASLELPAAETVRAELTVQGKVSAPAIEGAALSVESKAPPELPEVRVQRVGDLVVQSIRQSGNGGERTIRVQLVPESLGEMRITIRTSGDEVNVLMAVKHAAARETLELHTHALRESLAAEGFEPGKVSVQVSTGSDSGPGGFGRFGETAGQAGRTGHAMSRSYQPQTGPDEQTQVTRRSSSSTLDVLA